MPKALTLAPLERILKNVGAQRVSKEALKEFADVLEDHVTKICIESNALAKHAGRKTITDEDVKIARRKFNL